MELSTKSFFYKLLLSFGPTVVRQIINGLIELMQQEPGLTLEEIADEIRSDNAARADLIAKWAKEQQNG